MAPATRRSARTNVSPDKTTSTTSTKTTPPTTNSSTFSTAVTTPMTPGTEEDLPQPKLTTRARGKRKVAEIYENQPEDRPVVKRKGLINRAVVEIPIKKDTSSGEFNGKSSAIPTRKVSLSEKGKGKGPAKPTDDDEDSELEYDEKMSFDEDSGSDGSDFVVSDDLDSVQEEDDEDDEDRILQRVTRSSPRKAEIEFDESLLDDDELMLATAIALSRDDTGGASSSSKTSRNAEAALRAAAAELRIAQENDFGTESDEDSDSIPLSALVRKKGKRIVKKGGKSKQTPARILEKIELKKEEMALRKKLGRRLTYAERSTIALNRHHPELRDVWGDLETKPIVVPMNASQPANIKLTLLPFQTESLFWMQKQEQGEWAGGMLADEMGMGKTIQMIALLVSDGGKPNLVIAPTVAIMQWKNEIETHTDILKVLVWHGQSRQSDTKELAKYDVVLTTYAVLESAFRKQEKPFERKGKLITVDSPLHTMHWNRIILDEAHNIKERSTNTAKAAFALNGSYRWCLSGTPLQNRVGELYSLVRFLGGDPFSYYFCKQCDCKSLHWRFKKNKRTCDDCGHTPMQHTCFWNNEILTPIQKHGMNGPGKLAFKKLKVLLDRMMLRRTKIQRADDLGLPPRTVIVRKDYFSPEEKELYLSLFSDAKRQFTTYLDQGTVLNNYSNIFTLLTRMRQMACHPDLVLRSKTNARRFIPEDDEGTVCRICNDVAEDAIQSRCRHIFDRECIKQYLTTALEQTPACPVCHLPLTIDLEAPALELDDNVTNVRQGILGRLDLTKWRSSTKIEALVEELTNLRNQDATTKSLVFSQFVNFLDLIAFRLQRAGFRVCRLEGTMTPQGRDATIKHFMNNVDVTVFLVSLKAGGVALNLTEASRVYLMDSWWNPAVEFQAMDRIHRLGQHRPVKAIKIVVEDSIESRIVQLQEKKSAMVDATLSPDESAMGRLTPADLGFLFRL